MKFNKRLKMLRLEKGMTQKALATRLGVGRTTISEYESGNIVPKQDGLLLLAEILNVSVDYLTGVSNIPFAKSTEYSTIYELRVEEAILGTIKMLTTKLSGDNNYVVKYNGVDLNDAQMELMREQLRTTLIMLDHISQIKV